MDEDSHRRLNTNPLRILDSKNPELQQLIEQAPRLIDSLGEASKNHFNHLCDLLDAAGVAFEINPRLVRGLDYYSQTVFEWITPHLGAQSAVGGGGRYDGLVEQLGERPTPAVGFSLGLERLVLLLTQFELVPVSTSAVDVYLISVGSAGLKQSLLIAEKLRAAFPEKQIVMNCAEMPFKNQMKRADQSGAKIALILGENEIEQNKISIKYLREDKPQRLINQEELISCLFN